ncbi:MULTISPECIES: sulfotransferase domain-containing protein [Francisella]|uniref:sulfotransferase domain-containing protein n=1 Tax=Francisella TaxID=262 RepID=UPI0011B830AD|nr:MULTISPECIES: sulfotransferase domain-containing protein [Francisella]
MRLRKKILPLSLKKAIDKLSNGYFTKRILNAQEKMQIKYRLDQLEEELALSKNNLYSVEQEQDSLRKEIRMLKDEFDFMENACIYKKEPDFMIIGAQKAGTSSLFDYLDSLDGFEGSRVKETNFFDRDDDFNKGKDYYLSFFRCGKNIKSFEATPDYLYDPKTPKRINKTLNTNKFIVLLRNPVDRAYSQWNMWRTSFLHQNKREMLERFNISKDSYFYNLMMANAYPSFNETINEDICKYHGKDVDISPGNVRRGIYYDQIERYLEYYEMENFLFLDFRDLKNNTHEVLKQVFDFLDINGVDSQKMLDSFKMPEQNISNKGIYESKSDEDREVLEYLRDFYKPHNEKLYKLIGRRFDW